MARPWLLSGRRQVDGPPIGRLSLQGRGAVRVQRCDSCGARYRLITSYVLRDGVAYAVAKTALHDHQGREAWIDATFGTFSGDLQREPGDRITFGCRYGDIEGHPTQAASAVDAARPYADDAFWGRRLTRQEALDHPRIGEFWSVVDLLLETEKHIRRHMSRR